MNLPSNIDVNPDQISSLFKQLSGSLLDKFAENSPVFAQMLSAAAIMQSLSGNASHPYEQMKRNFFGENYQFKTINDLKAPESFNLDTITLSLQKISKQLAQTTLSSASSTSMQVESTDIQNLENLENFSFNPAEHNLIGVDVDLARKNIEFSEIVKSLTVDQLRAQPVEIAKKLIAHFAEMYK